MFYQLTTKVFESLTETYLDIVEYKATLTYI